jgi:superfamily II DNA or RNA helicase
MILFPYQSRAVEAATRSGVIVAPARSGKTIIAGHAALNFIARHYRRINLLWICNTNEQKQQAADALRCLAPVRNKVRGWIRHALHAADLPLEDIDLLVIDECHHSCAPEWAAVIARCTKARKIGLTATDRREDGLWPEVEKLIGPVLCRITSAEVAEQRGQVQATVRFHGVASDDCMAAEIENLAIREWPEREKKVVFAARKQGRDIAEAVQVGWSQLVHQKAVKYGLSEFAPRLEVTASVAVDALRRGRSTLLIVYSVEQGRELLGRIPGSRLVFSQMKVKTDGRRRDIIDAFRAKAIPCLIATSLADEGLDIPRADCLILAGGGRGISKQDCAITGQKQPTARIEQRTARVLTAIEDKPDAEIHDCLDRCHGMLRAASWSRAKAYKLMNYRVLPMPGQATLATSTSET